MYTPTTPVMQIASHLPDDARSASNEFLASARIALMNIKLGDVQGELALAYVFSLWALSNAARDIIKLGAFDAEQTRVLGAAAIARLRGSNTHGEAFSLRDELVRTGKLPKDCDAHLQS